MSEIPFVTRLGDAIETAIAAPERSRRRGPRRRRLGGLAVAVFLVGAAGVTIAEVLDDPERLAAGSIACHDPAHDSVSVLNGGGRRPAAVCAELLGTGDAPMAVCVEHDHVAVFPGRETCRQRGLDAVPAGYEPAREKVAALSGALLAIETRTDCIAPQRLARRAQRVLGRTGWKGFRAVVGGGAEGPCGWTHDRETGMFTPGQGFEQGVLTIYRGPPRSLDLLLRRAGLLTLSGTRCFTAARLKERVRRELARARYPVSFRLDVGPLPRYTDLEPPSRNRRFEEGCVVVEGVHPAYPSRGEIELVATLRLKGA